MPRQGEWEEAFLQKEQGSFGQGAWVSPFSYCCLTSCAVLSFFFFFLNWGQGWGGGQGKDLGKDCYQAWEQSREPLSAMGLAQSPRASF